MALAVLPADDRVPHAAEDVPVLTSPEVHSGPEALAVARRQEARSLELRAAMSLSRLWHQQGTRHEAHALLAEVYGWFTEGFDTADLQEAKALVEELA
jgi:predicted ATPase